MNNIRVWLYLLVLAVAVGSIALGAAASRQKEIAQQVQDIAENQSRPEALQFGLSMCALDISLTAVGTILGSALVSGLITHVGTAIIAGKSIPAALKSFFDFFAKHIAASMEDTTVTIASTEEAIAKGGAIAERAKQGAVFLKIGNNFIDESIGTPIVAALESSGTELVAGTPYRLSQAIKTEIAVNLQKLVKARLEDALRSVAGVQSLELAEETARQIPAAVNKYIKNAENLAKLLGAGGNASQADEILKEILSNQLTKQAKDIVAQTEKFKVVPVGETVAEVFSGAEGGSVGAGSAQIGREGADLAGQVVTGRGGKQVVLPLITEETPVEKLQNALKQMRADAEFRQEFQNIIRDSSVIKLAKDNASRISYALKLATTGGTIVDLGRVLATGPNAAEACYIEMAKKSGLQLNKDDAGAFAHLYIQNDTGRTLTATLAYPLSQDNYAISADDKRVYPITWGKHITTLTIKTPGLPDLVLKKNLVPYAKEVISATITLKNGRLVATNLRGVSL
jgi:hypothetical protein